MSTEKEFRELADALERTQTVIDAAMDQFHSTVASFNEDKAYNVTPTVEINAGKVKVDVRLYFKGPDGE